MSELLAPAGNREAFFAAINAGANAVYVGLNTFSARAYANNFSIHELKELVSYAHLRECKVFVTMNTIVFQNNKKHSPPHVSHINTPSSYEQYTEHMWRCPKCANMISETVCPYCGNVSGYNGEMSCNVNQQ